MKIKEITPDKSFNASYQVGDIIIVHATRDVSIIPSVYIGIELLKTPTIGELKKLKKLLQEYNEIKLYCNIMEPKNERFALFFGFTSIKIGDVIYMERPASWQQ